jgi:hypothetical protein
VRSGLGREPVRSGFRRETERGRPREMKSRALGFDPFNLNGRFRL